MERREVWGASSLDQYLADAEKKYTAESKVADLMTLQQFLRDRIAVETSLVETFGCPDAEQQQARLVHLPMSPIVTLCMRSGKQLPS